MISFSDFRRDGRRIPFLWGGDVMDPAPFLSGSTVWRRFLYRHDTAHIPNFRPLPFPPYSFGMKLSRDGARQVRKKRYLCTSEDHSFHIIPSSIFICKYIAKKRKIAYVFNTPAPSWSNTGNTAREASQQFDDLLLDVSKSSMGIRACSSKRIVVFGL